jgi:DNA-binding MarR family transcriptional regulator
MSSEPRHTGDRVVTLISLLRRTTQLMVNEITERVEASGFADAPPRFHAVFENLDPDGTRLTVLAARAGQTHQSMGEVVAELEQRGFVERIPDPADRRARLVRLTDSGRHLVRNALAAIDAIERDWTARWRAAGLVGDLHAPLAAALRDRSPTR